MTLNCIDRAQSPTHKGNLLQGRKSSLSHQQNANQSRKNSCSPPLTKANSQGNQQQSESSCKHLSSAKLESLHSAKLEKIVINESATERKLLQNTNSSRYKTELCRPYEENGTCKYGDKCQFAHGMKELRSLARHPKYKTELCRTFHSTGLCPYGPRCHFIHNSEATKKNLLTTLAPGGVPVGIRRKALASLGSDGELSPSSSNEGSPTDLKCFNIFSPHSAHLLSDTHVNDPVSPTQINGPLSPTHINEVFYKEISQESFHYQSLMDLADHRKGNIAPRSAEYLSYVYDDLKTDNYKYQDDSVFDTDNQTCQGGSLFHVNIVNNKCQGGPVLNLFPTEPSPALDNFNFLKFSGFEGYQQKIH